MKTSFCILSFIMSLSIISSYSFKGTHFLSSLSNSSQNKTMNPLFNSSNESSYFSYNQGDEEDELDSKQLVIDSVPYPKENPFEQLNIGLGLSSYFFDFIDPLLQKKISTEFRSIWNLAKNISLPSDKEYQEPYRLDVFFGENSNKRNFTFNQTIWENSLTAKHIYSIFKQWNWSVKKHPFYYDPIKCIVNKYDFNGDGRINEREFILMMIYQNKYSIDYPTEKRCTHCMENISKDIIEKLYTHITDLILNPKGVTAEHIWNGLKNLNRGTELYNIYQCDIRTNSVNDFVIKSSKNKGVLSKEEFRTGILLGYWTRQVKDDHIVIDDSFNGKSMRWVGSKDKICNRKKYN